MATPHPGGGESLARVSDRVHHVDEPVDQLLVTWVVLPLLSGNLPDCLGDLLSGSVALPTCWEAFWHLNDHVWGTGRVCCRLDRVSPASDFPGERPPSHIDNPSIPSTRSGDCVLLVSRENPELALRRHHGNGDSAHQSAVRHTLAWVLLTATFQFACEALCDAQRYGHQ